MAIISTPDPAIEPIDDLELPPLLAVPDTLTASTATPFRSLRHKIGQSLRQDPAPWLWGFLLVGLLVNGLILAWPPNPDGLMIVDVPAAAPILPSARWPKLVAETPTSPSELTLITEAGSVQKVASPRRAAKPKKADFQGVVNLNTASAMQLQQLPGIGEKMAGRILAYRKQIGRFASLEQLMDVEGIGPKKFAKLASHLKL